MPDTTEKLRIRMLLHVSFDYGYKFNVTGLNSTYPALHLTLF